MSSQEAPRGDVGRNRGRGRGGQGRGFRGGSRGAGQGSNGAPRQQSMSTADLSAKFQNNVVSPQTLPEPTTGAAEDSKGVESNEDVEAEVCFICASPVVHNSVAPCNHRTCHICAIRMRALYKTKDCAHCRVCSPIYGSHNHANKSID